MAPGCFTALTRWKKPGDLHGMKISGASRLVNSLLEKLGAEPVGMPVPAIPEA